VVGWDWRALRRVRRDRSERERHQAANGSAPALTEFSTHTQTTLDDDVQSSPRRGIRTESAPSFSSPTTPL
jgi:hypothetical protein